jgi:hypothetical protein
MKKEKENYSLDSIKADLQFFLQELIAIIEIYQDDKDICERLDMKIETREISRFLKTLSRVRGWLEILGKKSADS